MPYLQQNGVRLYYSVHGRGPLLLLTHGYCSSSEMWQGQIKTLSSHFTLILWDMRGHGQSDYPDDPAQYSEAHTISDMEAILNQVCGENTPAVVGGLSLGGYMSLGFYRVRPERVTALLIIDTGPGFKNDTARESWNRYCYQTAAELEREGLAHLQTRGVEARIAHHREIKGLVLAARGMMTQRDSAVIHSLPHIKVPALVVVGADDTRFLAAAEYMGRVIPGARKIVIDGAGHASNIDQPEEFDNSVLSFLRGLRNEARF